MIRPCGPNILGITHTDSPGKPYDLQDRERTNLTEYVPNKPEEPTEPEEKE